MSTTGQVKDFSDLYADLRQRMRGASTTATDNVLKRYINIAHQDIHIGQREKMPWAERRAVLVTQPDYSTGTVTITQGSTTLTGASTAWNTNNAFGVANARTTGKLVLNGGLEIYGISAVGGDTAITLASRFTQSDLSAASYVYYEDEYALASDFLRPVDPLAQFFDLGHTLRLMPRDEFRRRNFVNRTPGKPTECTIVDFAPSGNTTPIRRIAFNRGTDAAYTIPYAYVTKNIVVSSAGAGQEEFSADADESIIPFGYRHCITERALYFIYRDQRDDTRMNVANASFMDIWLRIASDQDLTQARPRMAARVGSYAARARAPMSRGLSGGVVSGTAFDEFRE